MECGTIEMTKKKKKKSTELQPRHQFTSRVNKQIAAEAGLASKPNEKTVNLKIEQRIHLGNFITQNLYIALRCNEMFCSHRIIIIL